MVGDAVPATGTRWQATRKSGPLRSGGSSRAQRSSATGQRGAKAQLRRIAVASARPGNIRVAGTPAPGDTGSAAATRACV